MGSGQAEDSHVQTVLLALCGLSPAVITETVWALAHETPSVLPGRVIALTTGKGREAIRRDLLASGAWGRLCEVLGASPSRIRFADTGDSVRVFPAADGSRELGDIATAEDSAAVGDVILETLRQFTENPDTRIVLSIAGGRKTMAALGALGMTLLGRPGDRLCHVLVSPPFDDPRLDPHFLFPDPATAAHTLANGTQAPAGDARITLCEIPFVRVRTLFAQHLRVLPGTFSRLVERANRSLEETPCSPPIAMDPARRRCEIDGTAVELSTPEFILFWMLCERTRRREGPLHGQEGLSRALAAFDAGIDSGTMPEKLHWDSAPLEEDSYVRRLASRLRTRLRQGFGAEPFWPLLDPTPERGHYGLRVSPDAIAIAGHA